jgi:hypothetical protein
MLYTLFILSSGVYLGQEYDIIPSIRILVANAMFYLRGLQDPNSRVADTVVDQAPGLFDNIKRFFFGKR